MTMHLTIEIVLYIAYLALALKRLMTYLHILQQDDYSNERLGAWMFQNGVLDKRLSFALLCIAAVYHFLPQVPEFIYAFAVFMSFAFTAYIEKDPRKDSKKKLALTTRAKRVLISGFIPAAIFGAMPLLINMTWMWVVAVHLIPLFLVLGNAFLAPFEDMIQKRYWREATEKLSTLKPKIIGITGSYGKTSVKHILGHILKMNAPTLITPGSVNTPMGITRIIREQLEPTHKYFVVEMGAYGPGSIKRLCALTPPDMGIITAIGHAHYERFKTLETVAEAKFELAQAVNDKGGKTVIHERTLRFPYTLEMKNTAPSSFIVCGEPKAEFILKDDVQIQGVKQTRKGLEVRMKWKDTTHIIDAPLFGLHHGHNIAMAFVAALELGLEPRAIQTALSKVPQIEHRLEVKEQPDKTTIIDDAFNSNPIGFQSALDLLNMMREGGRGILITPGMVEMGKAHDEAHEAIGKYAAKTCDIAIIVTPDRIPTFLKGFKEAGGKSIVEVKTFQEASAWLEKNKKPGDVILIENDLPDLYERIPKI